MDKLKKIPEEFEFDLRRAIEILQDEGCSEIFLFGSLVEGKGHRKSDLDIAIRGCPRGRLYRIMGRLMLELQHHFDIIRLDSADPFARHLEKEGKLIKIA